MPRTARVLLALIAFVVNGSIHVSAPQAASPWFIGAWRATVPLDEEPLVAEVIGPALWRVRPSGFVISRTMVAGSANFASSPWRKRPSGVRFDWENVRVTLTNAEEPQLIFEFGEEAPTLVCRAHRENPPASQTMSGTYQLEDSTRRLRLHADGTARIAPSSRRREWLAVQGGVLVIRPRTIDHFDVVDGGLREVRLHGRRPLWRRVVPE